MSAPCVSRTATRPNAHLFLRANTSQRILGAFGRHLSSSKGRNFVTQRNYGGIFSLCQGASRFLVVLSRETLSQSFGLPLNEAESLSVPYFSQESSKIISSVSVPDTVEKEKLVMSAPAVKPVLPAPNSGAQSPTSNAASPLKNHTGPPNNVAISLIQDKTPEKPKDTTANSNGGTKPTPNGVEAPKPASPTVNDKKAEETNHVPTPATPTAPVVSNSTPATNTATPPKGMPDKTPPAPSPPKTAATPPSVPTPTLAHATPLPASANTDKPPQATPPKTNSTVPPSEDKEKPATTSSSPGQVTAKRVVEKSEKPEKEKAAATPRTKRKRENAPLSEDTPESSKSKRTRVPVQPYQSPMLDLFSPKPKAPAKSPVEKDKDKDIDKEKLVIFYKNEFLAVRNSEGSFYVCQAMQNVYKSSHKIKIRWLSQQDGESKSDGTLYSPDFYDTTDFDCILTSLRLQRVDKSKFNLSKEESLRTANILKRALDVEKGVSEKPELTEEHPDGLDLSLFKDEAQLKKRKSQSKRSSGSPKRARQNDVVDKKDEKSKIEKKRTAATPKRSPVKKTASPRSGRKAKTAAKTPIVEKKTRDEKPVATSSRRAERASEREKAKETPAKTPAKRRADSSPVVVPEAKTPKTTARTAASAKKAAAEAKAAAHAAIAAAQAVTPAARKPPARGRRGEAPEPEVAVPPSRATKSRNVRSSSPADSEKKENSETPKDEAAPVSVEAGDAPASTTSATPATSAAESAAASSAPPVSAALPPSDGAAAVPAEPKVSVEPAAAAVSTESTAASEGESPSSDATRNRGVKKPTTTPPAKKA